MAYSPGRPSRTVFYNRDFFINMVTLTVLTEVADDTKDLFNHQISATTATVPPHDNLVILGDLNAVTAPPPD